MQELVFSPSDFVAVLNQTLEMAYPAVSVAGELANFRISKNKWVYFDLKDDYASVKFFGTVYQLPGPLEEGLLIQVQGMPRLHPQYGFSINIVSMRAVGEGSLKRAAALLEAKLVAEGLFDESRKRSLPFPPKKIGLITSSESAAYADFIKILNERWGGVEVALADVQVQGEQAPGQIIKAIEYFNSHAEPVEALVIIRGGGSADDLAAFSTEQVTRAVASSRIPTLVAIGHEVDISLAELAADRRASTPSNAAQMLVPDKLETMQQLKSAKQRLQHLLVSAVARSRSDLRSQADLLQHRMKLMLNIAERSNQTRGKLLGALNPEAPLRRGYALVFHNSALLKSVTKVTAGDDITIKLHDGNIEAAIDKIAKK